MAVDEIIKGVNVADLPVEQLEMILKIAKGLGLTIPPSLLRRADDVIH